MNLKKIQAFVLVMQKGSFSEAAEALGLTQPAVSSQIKGLENELGVRLLERFATSVELTPAGRYVYELGTQLLEIWEKMEGGVQHFHHTLTGVIRVGTSTIPGTYLLPRWIGGFHQRFPQITIENEVADSREIQSRLLGKKIDVAITGAPSDSPLVYCEPVAKDSLVLIAPADRENFPQFSNIDINRIAIHPFVLREEGSGTRRTMESGLEQVGIDLHQLQVVAHFGSTEAILSAVESGLGLSFVSQLAATPSVHAGRVRVLGSAITIDQTYYLSHLSAQQDAPKVKEFVNFIRSVCS